MRRLIGYTFIVAWCACAARADIGVFWDSTAPMKDHNNTSFQDYSSTDLYLVQLLWSASDPVTSDYTANYNTTDYLDASGAEILLHSYYFDPTVNIDIEGGPDKGKTGIFDFTEGGSLTLDFDDGDVTKADINQGYIYSRIFEPGTIGDGTYYFQSSVESKPLAESNPQGGDPPASVSHRTAVLDTSDGDPYEYTDTEMVPEPTTMGLLAVGLLTLAARKRRRPRA